MGFRLSWLVEGRVIEGAVVGGIQPGDQPAFDREMNRMLDAGTGEFVHYVTDASNMDKPASFNDLRKMTFPRHPRYGRTIVVGNRDPIQRMISTIAAGVFNIQVRQVDTMDAALEFLQQVDVTLPDLNAIRAPSSPGST